MPFIGSFHPRRSKLYCRAVHFRGKSLSRMYRDVGVSRSRCGFRHSARSSSFLSPMSRRPDTFFAVKIASLIFLPEKRFLLVASFQSVTRPVFSLGSSSLISRRRHSLSVSPASLRPPGNIQSPSFRRLTSSTLPRFSATTSTSSPSICLPVRSSQITDHKRTLCCSHAGNHSRP
jgi:hypothetical protein